MYGVGKDVNSRLFLIRGNIYKERVLKNKIDLEPSVDLPRSFTARPAPFLLPGVPTAEYLNSAVTML